MVEYNGRISIPAAGSQTSLTIWFNHKARGFWDLSQQLIDPSIWQFSQHWLLSRAASVGAMRQRCIESSTSWNHAQLYLHAATWQVDSSLLQHMVLRDVAKSHCTNSRYRDIITVYTLWKTNIWLTLTFSKPRKQRFLKTQKLSGRFPWCQGR